MATCPALLIAAPASGQGKTSVTCGLARLHARAGRRVQVFKCGLDFLDPQWLALASGQPVDNLDLWINGEADLRTRLCHASESNEVILIEGVMGLFDGEPSAADLAQMLGVPVLAVVDASAMAQTFGALVHGLRHYQGGLKWAGALANRVTSDGHAQMLQASVRADLEGPHHAGWLGALRGDAAFALPERHLGLAAATELPDAMARLDAMADALAQTPLGQLDFVEWQRWAVRFDLPAAAPPEIPKLLAGRTVAVAQDAAFCFIYPANLATLGALGARVVAFSPLADHALPPCDAVWLPGGYPELHAESLARLQRTRHGLAAHVAAGKPIWAECGGMMPLFEGLTLNDGRRCAMWGLLPGEVTVQPRLAALGSQQWDTPHGTLRGHSFHYSTVDTSHPPAAQTQPARRFGRPEAVYRHGALQASYFHAWFASSPKATAHLFLPEAA